MEIINLKDENNNKDNETTNHNKNKDNHQTYLNQRDNLWEAILH